MKKLLLFFVGLIYVIFVYMLCTFFKFYFAG